jgi:zinc transport system substrate-binding protein
LLTHARGRVTLRRALLAGLATISTGLGLTACGSTPSATPPTITVVTGLWPLAQAAAAIGGSSVQVTDVVPAGANPLTWAPDAAQRRVIQKADVVLEVGGGFQPGFERAAKENANTMYLKGPLAIDNPYLWLSPGRMIRVARLVYQTLNMSDPDAQATYTDGLVTFTSDLSEIASDYTAIFARCSSPTIVAQDSTFDVLRPSFDVAVRSLNPTGKTWPTATASATAPDAATVARQVHIINATKAHTVFSETWAPSTYLTAATQETGVKVVTLDSLAGVPTGPSAPASYLDGLADNLKLLSAGITC